MTDISTSDQTEDVQAALKRLQALVETGHFTREVERTNLLAHLNALRIEIDRHEPETLAGLPEALRHTEAFAIKRLVGPLRDETPDADSELSWEELGAQLRELVTNWEARHPKLGMAFVRFADLLSKLGI